MLLCLSLVRAVMGCSNAAPEISCGERSPDNSSVASVAPLCTRTPSPALEGQAALSRFIHVGRWGVGILALPLFLLPPQTKPSRTWKLLSTGGPVPTAPHHSQIFGAAEQGGMAFLCPPGLEPQVAPSPGRDPWVHSPLHRKGSIQPSSGFLDLSTC